MKAILALIIWSLLIAVFSLIPLESSGPELMPHQDKLIHMICYAVLAYLSLLAFGKNEGFEKYLKGLIFCIIYGIVIENAQAFLNTGRYFDYFDIIANIIGSLLGSLIYHFIRQK